MTIWQLSIDSMDSTYNGCLCDDVVPSLTQPQKKMFTNHYNDQIPAYYLVE